MIDIIMHIKSKAPIAYKEFESFVKQHVGSFMDFHRITIEILPKSLAIGLFLEYFDQQNIEFSIGDTNEKIILEDILKTFEEYEKVISHYS
jgi:hypothetical protein